ncbi:MAG: MgtC/SapB family protein [Alphaproteobacteria bacterium]|nr:MgtC/SapB family protein [Alphaproteobacteria bacterium]
MDLLMAYWSGPELIANGIILLHLLGAAAVGIVLGYERTYHGRAAGMRTYVLVCLTSTALTVINAFPGLWYGGLIEAPSTGDPTRVVQGILTGMGFLGAGVIMRDGFSIRGLSTAASLWATTAIGVLIGVGFYAAAIASTLIAILVMSSFRMLERVLPHHRVLHLMVASPRNAPSPEGLVRQLADGLGYKISEWSLAMDPGVQRFDGQLVLAGAREDQSQKIVETLAKAENVTEFRLSPQRN